MLLTPQTQDIVAIFSPVTCHIYFTSQFVHVGQNQVQSRNFPGCFLCFLGNKIACRASQELVRCSGVSSMRCFIGLDFLGGRNSARATLGKRGLMSSQNLGESRSSTAGLRGPRGQQVGLLPAPFCAWPHALLIQTDCLPVRGRRARPAPGHRGHSEAPETPRSLTLAACPHPGQGRETAMGEQAKHLSSPNPSFPL